MKLFIYFILAIFIGPKEASAFVVSNANNAFASSSESQAMPAVNIVLRMVGGRGWDNDDFLSSLSGDEDERKKSREDYDDFSDRRASFNARQAEIMKSPQAQAFMKQRQEQQMRYLEEEQGQGDLSGDGTFLGVDVPEGSGGGTRMGRMMEQAKRMQGQRGQSNMIGGLHHQQLLGPLDEDDDEEKEV